MVNIVNLWVAFWLHGAIWIIEEPICFAILLYVYLTLMFSALHLVDDVSLEFQHIYHIHLFFFLQRAQSSLTQKFTKDILNFDRACDWRYDLKSPILVKFESRSDIMASVFFGSYLEKLGECIFQSFNFRIHKKISNHKSRSLFDTVINSIFQFGLEAANHELPYIYQKLFQIVKAYYIFDWGN